MKKAIYKPTKQKTIIINELDNYCEIFLDGEYKTVSKNALELESEQGLSTLDELKENIFLNCVKNPLSDILYSYNSNRLIPEPHQYKPLIKFLNSENNRILIADEVGLGKTIEAGMIYKEIDKREELKISLIVVPSSLTYKWQDELNIRFDEHFSIYKTNKFINFIDEVENSYSSKLINERIIISYHTLRDDRVTEKLNNNSFFKVDFLIMDEAHTMRNTGTSTFSSAEIITSLSEHIIFLSATPVQNSLNDLFNILSLLDNDYFKDNDYFEKMIKPNSTIHKLITYVRNNYSLDEIKNFIIKNRDETNSFYLKTIFDEILELKNLHSSKKVDLIDKLISSDHLSFIINRTKKKDVGLAIPRNATSVIVEITKNEQEYYNSVIEFVKFLNPGTPQGFITIMPERMASSSIIASLESFKKIKKSGKIFVKDVDDLDKEEDLKEEFDLQKEAELYLDDIISKGKLVGQNDSKFLKFEEILKDLKSQNIKKMIVFSFFKKTLDYLEVKLKNLGYSIGKIHGDFSIEDRFSKIKEFKHGSFDILLSSEVGSEGLDMQFCNVVINYDLPWNPMRVEQRIGRIDRIGQKFDKLHIFNLCIVGSIEDRILNRLYSKLNIFEDSVGELEPILGELEKELNIPELMNLSQFEIDKRLNLKELAIERKKLEITEQSIEFQKMLNDELDYDSGNDKLLNPLKVNILQEQCRKIFINYLEINDISFLELKSKDVKISSINFKKLFNLLKSNMSDGKRNPLQYKEERNLLQKISSYEELKVSFSTNNNDEFQTLYLFLNNPIILIIIKDKVHRTTYSILSNHIYNNGYAIIYRVDFKQLKLKSHLKTILLSDKFKYIDEIDYFEFIHECTPIESILEINFNEIKDIVNNEIIISIENQSKIEKLNQNRQIDIKIDSIKNYFDKQIHKVKRLENKVLQEDVKRMRIGEIDNLEVRRNEKIKELENQKEIKSSFEILGVVKIENNK